MLTILDFEGLGGRKLFRNPQRVIAVENPHDVTSALQEIGQALGAGCHVAGWFSYELGYLLEPRLSSRAVKTGFPLLKFGVYEPPENVCNLDPGDWRVGQLVPEWSLERYRRAFDAVHEYICQGDIYQANLSFRARFPFRGDALSLYEHLRAQTKSPYCAYLDDQMRQIASISPELFFAITSEGVVNTKPMKGTIARSGDDAADRETLLSSEKDRAENLMIVDLIRNDLSKVCRVGSVRVPELFSVENYPTFFTMTFFGSRRDHAGDNTRVRSKGLVSVRLGYGRSED